MTAEEQKRAVTAMTRRLGRTEASAELLRMPAGAGTTDEVAAAGGPTPLANQRLPANLWLNNVPNQMSTRLFFYDAVVAAVEAGLSDRAGLSRMRVDVSKTARHEARPHLLRATGKSTKSSMPPFHLSDR